MIPWWRIVFSFAGALIVAVGLAFTVPGWPRYVTLCGSVLTAVGGLWFAIHQVSYQTGGDSYGYLRPSFTWPATPKDYTVTVFRIHQGQYPLSDLVITVTDIEKFHEHMDQNPSGLVIADLFERRYTWPRLEAESAAMLFNWQLPRDRDEQSYNIGIVSTRNMRRGVSEQLRFRRINGEWWIALRVIRDNQVLIEQGRQYLPRDEKGQAIWEKRTSRWAR